MYLLSCERVWVVFQLGVSKKVERQLLCRQTCYQKHAFQRVCWEHTSLLSDMEKFSLVINICDENFVPNFGTHYHPLTKIFINKDNTRLNVNDWNNSFHQNYPQSIINPHSHYYGLNRTPNILLLTYPLLGTSEIHFLILFLSSKYHHFSCIYLLPLNSGLRTHVWRNTCYQLASLRRPPYLFFLWIK
jgi:hypothetical protein